MAKKHKNKKPADWKANAVRRAVAQAMAQRGRWGAGDHGDKRKEQSKRACRGRVKWDNVP